MSILKAPRLKKRDLIGLVSPASPPSSSEKIDGAVRYLEDRGYDVKVGKHVMDEHGYLAGTDEARLEDLNAFIRDERMKAIIAVRGGYGTPRLLAGIDYDALRKQPKVIVGYSDLTGLQSAVLNQIGLITFSGPMAGVEMWDSIDPYTEENFWRMVESPDAPGLLTNPEEEPVTTLKGGTGQGPLIGGNLSLLINLFGTRYLPAMQGSVLILEDVDEAPHRIDRMFTQMQHADVWKQVSGAAFAAFTDCTASDPDKPHRTVNELQKEFAAHVNGPVLANIQYGHIPKKLTMPIGAQCRVDGSKGTIEILESVVR
jgi:muramoyltetrapeptide carboxypeptidase